MRVVAPQITAIGSYHLSATNTGLGNVLFQIASCQGLARDTRRVPSFHRVGVLCKILEERQGFNHRTTIFRNLSLGVPNIPLILYQDLNAQRVNPSTRTMLENSPQSFALEGYLESPSQFHAYRDDLCKIFEPDVTSRRLIEEAIPELSDPLVVPISVHVRQGNDANSKNSREWYLRAVHTMKERFPNAIFLAFSDRELGDLGFPYRQIHLPQDQVELWAQSLCKHNILSASTFAWWGAYLNSNPEKYVVYSEEFLNQLSHREHLSRESLQSDFFRGCHCIP